MRDRPPVSAAARTCLVLGAGDGLGASVAKAFAAEGLVTCIARRPRHLEKLRSLADEIAAAGGAARVFGVDAREEDAVARLFADVEAIGPLEVVVFNVGANVWFPITETTARVYRKLWEMGAFAGFLAGREAARAMTPRGRGTILFTGASASLRGSAQFAAFAGAKAALRALAQSMARELGPKGVHVAHVIVDGVIDGPFARDNVPDVDARAARAEILDPDEIAKTYVHLWKQEKSAWTHELDLRPWAEKW